MTCTFFPSVPQPFPPGTSPFAQVSSTFFLVLLLNNWLAEVQQFRSQLRFCVARACSTPHRNLPMRINHTLQLMPRHGATPLPHLAFFLFAHPPTSSARSGIFFMFAALPVSHAYELFFQIIALFKPVLSTFLFSAAQTATKLFRSGQFHIRLFNFQLCSSFA